MQIRFATPHNLFRIDNKISRGMHVIYGWITHLLSYIYEMFYTMYIIDIILGIPLHPKLYTANAGSFVMYPCVSSNLRKVWSLMLWSDGSVNHVAPDDGMATLSYML